MYTFYFTHTFTRTCTCSMINKNLKTDTFLQRLEELLGRVERKTATVRGDGWWQCNFPGENRVDACMNPKPLWQHPQDLQKLKLDKIPAHRRGCAWSPILSLVAVGKWQLLGEGKLVLFKVTKAPSKSTTLQWMANAHGIWAVRLNWIYEQENETMKLGGYRCRWVW